MRDLEIIIDLLGMMVLVIMGMGCLAIAAGALYALLRHIGKMVKPWFELPAPDPWRYPRFFTFMGLHIVGTAYGMVSGDNLTLLFTILSFSGFFILIRNSRIARRA